MRFLVPGPPEQSGGLYFVMFASRTTCSSTQAIPILSFFGGVYWTKFECISDKIRRILTNDTCASAALDKLARGKTQKFPIIFICGSPHTPRREAENLKGRKFLVLLPPLHSSKKANKYSLAFLPVLRPPFLRRLRRPEALPSPRLVVVR